MANADPVDKSTRLIPPYVPYRTFLTFLDSLKVGVPSHIDKSVLKSMSGGMQQWLKASLRAMKLVDHDSVPQAMLYDLASSPDGHERKKLLKEVFASTYAFLRESVELEVTTPAKLESAFIATGATGDTVRKCIAFMLSMAKDAGVELSPHLLKRGAIPRRAAARQSRQKNGTGANTGQKPQDAAETRPEPPKPPVGDWMDQLLGKFPNFDPDWPDELKAKWFEGFERLMNARK